MMCNLTVIVFLYDYNKYAYNNKGSEPWNYITLLTLLTH
jgi:hypothetical protein